MERRTIVKLKFVRSWRSYRSGQTVDIPGGLAAELIARKVAVEDKQPTLIETAAIEVRARTADATPRRKTKR
jgi:hypothetical protein